MLATQAAEMESKLKDQPTLEVALANAMHGKAEAERKLHAAVNDNQNIQEQVCLVSSCVLEVLFIGVSPPHFKRLGILCIRLVLSISQSAFNLACPFEIHCMRRLANHSHQMPGQLSSQACIHVCNKVVSASTLNTPI